MKYDWNNRNGNDPECDEWPEDAPEYDPEYDLPDPYAMDDDTDYNREAVWYI